MVLNAYGNDAMRLQVDIEGDLKDWLKIQAAKEKRTQSDLVEDAIRLYQEKVDAQSTANDRG